MRSGWQIRKNPDWDPPFCGRERSSHSEPGVRVHANMDPTAAGNNDSGAVKGAARLTEQPDQQTASDHLQMPSAPNESRFRPVPRCSGSVRTLEPRYQHRERDSVHHPWRHCERNHRPCREPSGPLAGRSRPAASRSRTSRSFSIRHHGDPRRPHGFFPDSRGSRCLMSGCCEAAGA